MPKFLLALSRCASAYLAIILCALACYSSAANGADKAADQAAIDRVNAALSKAAASYKANKLTEAAAALAEAQTAFKGLDPKAVDPTLKTTVERLGDRIAAAERLINKPAGTKANSAKESPDKPATEKPNADKPASSAGKSSTSKSPDKSASKSPKSSTPQSAKSSSPAAKPPKGRKAAAKGPSFKDEVAPILLAKCGDCHVKKSSGDLNMATYADLAKGSKNGQAVYPGLSGQSPLTVTIATGKMPKGEGPKVTPEELAVLANWIDSGALNDVDETKPADDQTTKNAGKPPKGRKGAAKNPSFHDDVAPILIAKCGQCHVKQTSGGLSMATFTDLSKGGKSGPAVRPGFSGQSPLTVCIATGKMPKGDGPKVTPDELAVIANWINGGARYDGEDRDSPLGQKTAAPKVEVKGLVQATGNESVQFNRDLAETLVTQCAGCHGGDTPSGQLRLETFADLLKGGTSGEAIEPGKPGESLITKRMRGEDGDRMPQDKPPLPEATIAKFETWIKEGAKFDGADPARMLKSVVADQAASRMSHDELAEKRLAEGLKTWRLAAPDEQPAHRQTENFILIGNLSEARLDQLAAISEAERVKIARLLKLPADQQMFKGNLVLFVFKRAFDYSEFVQMVEKREAPRGMIGHWQAKGLDAYACVTASSDSDANLPALFAEQIAGAYLQSVSAPGWFAVGGARAITAKVEPKSAAVKQWEEEIGAAAAGAVINDGLFKAKVFDEETSARSYAFVKFLLTSMPKFQSLVNGLKEGHPFPSTLRTVYGNDAQGLLEAFSRRPPPKGKR